MRYLYLLLLSALLSAPFASQAQMSGSDSLRLQLNTIFAPLDKSQVPTAYLEEYGVRLPLAAPLRRHAHRFQPHHARSLHYLRAALRSARVTGTDTLPSLPELNRRLEARRQGPAGAPNPIAVQYMSYNRIRPDALQNNLLTVQNNQLYDVAGRSQSPGQRLGS